MKYDLQKTIVKIKEIPSGQYFLSTKEVANILGITRQSLTKRCRTGSIEYTTIPGTYKKIYVFETHRIKSMFQEFLEA